MATYFDQMNIETWARGMWPRIVDVARMPSPSDLSTDATIELLNERADILDMFRQYHVYYDAKDIDGILSVFAGDCVVINPRGTYRGLDAIRKNYVHMCSRWRFTLHFGPNPFVRVEPDLTTGWLLALSYGISVLEDLRTDVVCGTYINHVVKDQGRWKIREQRITTNFRYELSLSEFRFTAAPPATRELSSRDLIEPETVV